MKTFKWKRLVYAFLILGLLGACGNSNKSGETTLVNNGTDTIPTGTSGTVPYNLTTVDQFITAVTNGQFAAPTSSSMTYEYIVHNGLYSSNASSNMKCTSGFFKFCYYVNTSTNSNNYNYIDVMKRIVSSSTIARDSSDDYKQTTLLNLKSALITKLTNAKNTTRYVEYYGSLVKVEQFKIVSGNEIIYIDNNHCYKIDLSKPLAANPTSKYKFESDQCKGAGYELMNMY